MTFEEIAAIATALYSLEPGWVCSFGDAQDPNVLRFRLGKKNEKGRWIRGKQNEFWGYIPNYKEYQGTGKADSMVEAYRKMMRYIGHGSLLDDGEADHA